MHEIMKRDSSSGVMEREENGVAAPDWQGCSHRYVPTREGGRNLAYYLCISWQSGQWDANVNVTDSATHNLPYLEGEIIP